MNVFNETIYRSLGFKEDISFLLNGFFDITTGFSSLGLSGDNGKTELFSFKNGQIFDFNKKYVYSYNPNQIFEISGNLGNGYINYYINNNPVLLYNDFTNSSYKYLYVESDKTNLSIDIFIKSSDSPKYQIEFVEPINLGSSITGFILNTDSNTNSQIQIFSGIFTNQNLYELTGIYKDFISGGKSGELTLQYNSSLDSSIFFENDSVLNQVSGLLILETNFGTLLNNVSLDVKVPGIYFIDFIEIFTGLLGTPPNSLYTYRYELLLKSTFSSNNITLTLENFSGHSGEQVLGSFPANGILQGTLNNFIYGEDYITGNITGTIESTNLDFFDQPIIQEVSIFKKELIFATGDINYNYRIFMEGGSGFGSAPPGLTVEGFGTGELNKNVFIFKNRTVTGSGNGILTGTWQGIFQSGSGIFNTQVDAFFTGNFNLDYKTLLWSGSSFNLGDNPNKTNLIYGITGFNNFVFLNQNSGVLQLNELLNSNQSTGIVLKKTIPFTSFTDFNNSGLVTASSNESSANNLFYPNSNFWFFPNTVGYVEFSFLNFAESDKLPVTHYELDLNINNSNLQPYIFSLQGRNNETDPYILLDSRTGENFYSSQKRIFEVKNSGFFNFIRLNISGDRWIHKNYEEDDSDIFVLNKFNLYTIDKYFSGPGFLEFFSKVNANTFIIQENNINYTGNISAPFESNVLSERAYNAFSFDNTAKISGYNSGLFIKIKTPKPVSKKISGFYLEYEQGYKPKYLNLKASVNDINYVDLLNLKNLQTINSGFLNIQDTGFQFFNFDYSYKDCIEKNWALPNSIDIAESTVFICGTVNNTNTNYINFNYLSSPSSLGSIQLLNYDKPNFNSTFTIKSGNIFIPLAPSIASGNINASKLNINLITGLEKTGSIPFLPGNYVIEIKTTGTSNLNYRIAVILTNLSKTNLIIENAGFNILGESLNGNYILSNNYNSNRTWNNYPYYENILLGKNGAIWWDSSSGWLLGGGSELSINPNNYEYIYASGGFFLYPFFNNVWYPIPNRPSPLTSSLIDEETSFPGTPNQPTITNLADDGGTVNWNLVSNFSVYYLDIATDSSFNNIVINNLRANGSRKKISGLNPVTQYYVRVRAENNIGTSSSSITQTFTTLIARPVPPNQPTSTNVGTTSFTANWNSVSSATSYRIDVSTSSLFAQGFFVGVYNNLTVNGTSQAVTGLTANTTYYVRVRAVNAGGTSLSSATLTQATLPVAPVAPNQPTITPGAGVPGGLTDVSFTANWNSVSSATSYRIDVSTSSLFAQGFFVGVYNNLTVNGTSQAVTGLTANTTYYVRVRAVNSAGTSAPSPTLIQATAFGPLQFVAARAATKIQLAIPVPSAYESSNHSYFLELSTTSNFSNIVFNRTVSYVVGGPAFFTEIFSVTNQTYYLRSRTAGPMPDGLSTYSLTSTIPPI